MIHWCVERKAWRCQIGNRTVIRRMTYYTVKIQKTKQCRNESGRFGALKSDSTHYFFRNACTKSGSLRFSQFSGCWLILSVYILMSFDFPFERLFGVRNFVITLIHKTLHNNPVIVLTFCGRDISVKSR